MLGTLKQALETYILSNGTGEIDTDTIALHIDMSHFPLVSDGTNDKFYASKHFLYEIYCGKFNNCYINAFRYQKADYSDLREHYALALTRLPSACWYTQCYYKDSFGLSICKTLPDVTLHSW